MKTTGKILLFTFVASLPLAATAEIYKYVDENGVTRYTDKPPSKDAKPIQLPPVQTYSGAGISPSVESSEPDNPAEATGDFSYSRVELVNPTDQQVFHNANPTVNASVAVNPGLQEGHRLVFFVDGVAFPAEPGQTSLELTELARGSHRLQAMVMDANDKIQAQSDVVSFHLSPPSIQQPNPINALPRPP